MTDGGARRGSSANGDGDGRNIDPSVGTLAGEGAQQRVEHRTDPRLERLLAREATDGASGDGTSRPDGVTTYYDRPVIKEPVWKWYIGAYFVLGGMGGAAASLGAAAQVLGRGRMERLVAACRAIASGSMGAGTVLLILDLGRPERFLNMVRVFRPSSPMNVGSWILAPAATFSTVAAALGRARGPLRAVGAGAGGAAGVFGGPMTTYTAVLVSTNAIPIWQAVRRSLPALFAATAAGSAASALHLVPLSEEEHAVVDRLARWASVAELVAARAVEREANRVEAVGAPLREGFSGALWRTSKALAVASVAVSALPIDRRRKRVLAGVLGTAGAAASKFAIFRAGFPSARDPVATFSMQRAGSGGAAVTGRPATTGPAGEGGGA